MLQYHLQLCDTLLGNLRLHGANAKRGAEVADVGLFMPKLGRLELVFRRVVARIWRRASRLDTA